MTMPRREAYRMTNKPTTPVSPPEDFEPFPDLDLDTLAHKVDDESARADRAEAERDFQAELVARESAARREAEERAARAEAELHDLRRRLESLGEDS